MDWNGMTGDGFGIGAMPTGFGIAPFMDVAVATGNADLADAERQPAPGGYDGLTEAEKERLLMRCKDAGTMEKMQKIVDSVLPDTDVRAILDGGK